VTLRRAENVSVCFATDLFTLFTGKGRVEVLIGKTHHRLLRKVHKTAYAAEQQQQWTYPVLVVRVGERQYWQFQGRFHWDNDDLRPDDVYALLVTRQQRARGQVDRAKEMVVMGGAPRRTRRGHISDELKHYIWMRDGGRCRHCGSGSEIQYDHVIPVSKGGATSAENLQILCGKCNRRKSDGLTVR
jgi:5-methylcytosine-specific restriction endonuclease McrA